MLSTYYRLIYNVNKSPFTTGLIIILSLAIPIAISLVQYNQIVTLIALAFVGGIVGSILFYDVRTYLFYVYPVVHLLTIPILLSVLTLMLVVSFMASLLQSGRVQIRIPYLTLILFILLGAIIGYTRASNSTDARMILQYTYMFPIIVFIVIYNVKPSVRLIRVNLLMLCIIGALVGWISLALYMKTGVSRVLFRWPSQNLGAAFLSLLLPYSLVSLVNSKRPTDKGIWLFLFLGIGAGILVTQTRAILFTSFISVLYIGWKNRIAIKTAIPILISVIVIAPALIITRILMLFGRGEVADWSAVGRIEIWINSISFVPKYLFFGMGLDNFYSLYRINFPHGFILPQHPHNMFLHSIFELGIIGLVGYTFIIVSTFIRGHNAIKNTAVADLDESQSLLLPINAGIVSVFSAGMVDSYLRDPRTSIVFWSFMAYQLILSNRHKNSQAFAK